MYAVTIPIRLFLAFTEDDVCPQCLSCLHSCETCPRCGVDLSPVFDHLEELEAEGRLPEDISVAPLV